MEKFPDKARAGAAGMSTWVAEATVALALKGNAKMFAGVGITAPWALDCYAVFSGIWPARDVGYSLTR